MEDTAMSRTSHSFTAAHIRRYAACLGEQERAPATIRKYVHDLNALLEHLDGAPITKAALIAWKEELTQRHAPATVNSMLAAVNGFLAWMGWRECAVKLLKIQKSLFCAADRELTKAEYARLVRAAEAKENRRLSLVMQTICATGIRVSELRFITVEAVGSGRAEIVSKGKRRTVFLPQKLRRLLRDYLRAEKSTAGTEAVCRTGAVCRTEAVCRTGAVCQAVFVTRTGRPLDRSNIWRDMKRLCERAGVEPSKVFPHNLCHLFARTFYALEKDLSRLADMLGHSSVNTTRIYTIESGAAHARQLERMGLILTT